MGWARLLKRVFGIDIEHCPQCAGDLKIIAAIEEPAVIVKILTHLGLPARAPQGGLSFSLWRGGAGCFIGALLCPIDSAVLARGVLAEIRLFFYAAEIAAAKMLLFFRNRRRWIF